MKKLFALLLVLPFLFAACSDDDDNNSIVGTWVLDSYTAIVETNDADVTEAIEKELKKEFEEDLENVKANDEAMTFNQDGTFSSTEDEGDVDDDFIVNQTYKFNKDVLTLTSSYKYKGADGKEIEGEDVSTVNCTVSGDKLVSVIDETEDYQYEYQNNKDAVVSKVLVTRIFKRK